MVSESPEAARWPAQAFENDLPKGTFAKIAVRGETIMGFLVARFAADEFEILNLAVARRFRRLGIASKLLNAALQAARQAGCTRCHLEVRASNLAAQGLYLKHRFQLCGRRPGYYREPVEDAILLVRVENGV